MRTIFVNHCCILLVASSMTFVQALANDYFTTGAFGNVRTGILTGFQYEEINKVAIFGQLAETLCKELNYSDIVYLDFIHNYYVDNCLPRYFISYQKVDYWEPDSNKWLENNAIVIRQAARQFHAQPTLKLLENAILNLNKIKSSQEEILFKRGFDNMIINTIDTLAVKKMLDIPNSVLLNNVLKTRIDRPEKDFREGISYYWQNNRYFVFQKYRWYVPQEYKWNEQEVVLFDMDNIYDLLRFKNWSAMIFDSGSSFYSVKQSALIPFGEVPQSREDKPKISKRHVIENTDGSYQPFKVENMGGDKISIYFWRYIRELGALQNRTLIYLADQDILIQDLDKLIFNHLNVKHE